MSAGDEATEGQSDRETEGKGASLFGFFGEGGTGTGLISHGAESTEVSRPEIVAPSAVVMTSSEMGASGREAREASGGGDRGQGTGDRGGVLVVATSSEVLGTEYSVQADGRPAVGAWAGSGDPHPTGAMGSAG